MVKVEYHCTRLSPPMARRNAHRNGVTCCGCILFYPYIELSTEKSSTPFRRQPHHIYLIPCFDYIIPIPGAPPGIAGASSLILATTDSVVNKVEATLVAF